MARYALTLSPRILTSFAFLVGLVCSTPTGAEVRASESYGKLPLHFEANQGQAHKDVRFFSRGPGYGLYLTGSEAVLVLSTPEPEKNLDRRSEQRTTPTQGKSVALRMGLVGAAPAPLVSGLEELPGKANYFVGKDSSQWRTNVPTYAKVHYREVYPGIDLVYYGNQRQLEYDFIVAPGADPDRIALTFKGAKRLEIDAKGDLVLHLAGGVIRQHKPVIYQEIDGVRQQIAGSYVRRGANRVGFKVAAYDRSRPLVIDPMVLAYSTYLGGSGWDSPGGIAVDAGGNAYVVGATGSLDFPTTPGAFQPQFAGGRSDPSGLGPDPGPASDVFVTKLNASGTGLVYSTYLGGARNDYGAAIAVDAAGNAYVTGSTTSTNFPTTVGAFQLLAPTGTDPLGSAFVTKLNSAGSLVYSTYLGGSGGRQDFGVGIAVDSDGHAYVTGETSDSSFPITPNAFRTTPIGSRSESFVAKFNPAGSGLVYSTYLGGSGSLAKGIAVDGTGNAYVTGTTTAIDHPTTPGAYQINRGGGTDAFITTLNATGSALIYATYLGGSNNDFGIAISVDAGGNAYVTGSAGPGYPVTPGAVQTTHPNSASGGTAFVTKVAPDGSTLIYSTYLGGSVNDAGLAIAADSAGNSYVTGYAGSPNFPTTPDAIQRTYPGGIRSPFVTKLNSTGSALIYSTFLGGNGHDSGSKIAVDAAGNAYVTGFTESINFPITPGAFQATYGGAQDVFVAKIVDSSFQPFRLEENAAIFAGSWPSYGTEAGAFSGGRVAASNQTNATATFRFTGTAIKWVGAKCNECGIAAVSIDGGTPVSVNTFTNRHYGSLISEIVFTASGLAPGVTHTLTITVTGTSTPGSNGTYIAVDAFDVTPMRMEQNAAAYAGPWPSYGSDVGAFSGGNVVASNQTDATATFSFTGTAVSWLGVKCNVCGIATVSIDGGAPVTVNTFGPGTPGSLVWDSVFYASGLAPNATHTLRITVTGSADGASGGSYIAVDGFDVTR